MKSIRAFLLLSVSLLVLLALLVSAWLTFDRARYEVDELFDAELAQTARVLRSTVAVASSVAGQPGDAPLPPVSTPTSATPARAGVADSDERTR